MWPYPQETADLVTFTKEILKGKLHFLCSVTTPNQRGKRVNYFINSQFPYCSFIWMFTLKACNKRIDRIHEKSLGRILSDYESWFYDMLSTINWKTIRQRCLDVLLTEVYRISKWPLSLTDAWSFLFGPKPLKLMQFKCLCHG